ncbi:Myb-like_DNA-binding domain-containing protein [Hexamita inflata]|uniref:Myb-like DNA-binding domain-containing protein n=1 Tax=Hexamita inflata TaxID=28002 RepID=A0AA86REW1_9EUKA|nr:Myb-like DNA-binding domain-containing protein [Hexamita inflata]
MTDQLYLINELCRIMQVIPESQADLTKNQRWSEQEQFLYIKAIEQFGKDKPTKIAAYVKTKTVRQVISHTQKTYQKFDQVYQGALKGIISSNLPFNYKTTINSDNLTPDQFENVSIDSKAAQLCLDYQNQKQISKLDIVNTIPECVMISKVFHQIHSICKSQKIALEYTGNKFKVQKCVVALVASIM